MKKRRVLDVSDVDYVEIRVNPKTSKDVIQEEPPEVVSPSFKGIVKLTGKLVVFGIVGIILVVKAISNSIPR